MKLTCLPFEPCDVFYLTSIGLKISASDIDIGIGNFYPKSDARV